MKDGGMIVQGQGFRNTIQIKLKSHFDDGNQHVGGRSAPNFRQIKKPRSQDAVFYVCNYLPSDSKCNDRQTRYVISIPRRLVIGPVMRAPTIADSVPHKKTAT